MFVHLCILVFSYIDTGRACTSMNRCDVKMASTYLGHRPWQLCRRSIYSSPRTRGKGEAFVWDSNDLMQSSGVSHEAKGYAHQEAVARLVISGYFWSVQPLSMFFDSGKSMIMLGSEPWWKMFDGNFCCAGTFKGAWMRREGDCPDRSANTGCWPPLHSFIDGPVLLCPTVHSLWGIGFAWMDEDEIFGERLCTEPVTLVSYIIYISASIRFGVRCIFPSFLSHAVFAACCSSLTLWRLLSKRQSIKLAEHEQSLVNHQWTPWKAFSHCVLATWTVRIQKEQTVAPVSTWAPDPLVTSASSISSISWFCSRLKRLESQNYKYLWVNFTDLHSFFIFFRLHALLHCIRVFLFGGRGHRRCITGCVDCIGSCLGGGHQTHMLKMQKYMDIYLDVYGYLRYIYIRINGH